jgi:hypothetical protein
MKKLIIIVFISHLAVSALFSQPNGGFEDWVSEFTYETPVGWQTLNFLSLTSPPNPLSAFKAIGIDRHSGNYALKLKSVYINNNPIHDSTQFQTFGIQVGDTMAAAFTGFINVSPITYGYGFPYNGRPSKLEFWAKYNPVGNDTACAGVFLKRSNNTGGSDTIGAGRLFIPATPVYTLFQLPIEYFSDSLPDSATIGFSPSPIRINARLNSTLYIDDVVLTGWVGINELNLKQSVKVFPNPAKESITVYSEKKEARTIRIVTTDGNIAKIFTLSENTATINISSLTNGLYIYEVYDSKNKLIGKGKLSIVK